MPQASIEVFLQRDASVTDDGEMRIGGSRTGMWKVSPEMFRSTLLYVCKKQKGEGDVIVTVPKDGIAVVARIGTTALQLLLDNGKENDIVTAVNYAVRVLSSRERKSMTGTFGMGGLQ